MPVYVPPQPRPRRLWLHWLLFLLTLASTTFVGAEMFAYYEVDVATLLAMAPADRQQ